MKKKELKEEWHQGLLRGAVITSVVIIIFSAILGYPLWNANDKVRDEHKGRIYMHNLYLETSDWCEGRNLTSDILIFRSDDGMPFYGHMTGCIEDYTDIDYKIPDNEWISNWCRERGYTKGWLSGTCDGGFACIDEKDGYTKRECKKIN